MNILLEIFREFFFYFQAIVYTFIGLFIKVQDSPEGDKNPVILIPGLGGSPLTMTKLRRFLISRGYPVYSPRLSLQIPFFEVSARRLEQFILERNLKDVYIIAHSAGGIIVTQMGYKGRDRVKKFFAVSSPFHGSWLALLTFFLPAGRQLIPGSAFLKNNEINFLTFPNLQCLFSRFDLMIIPGFQGRLGRVDDMEFEGLGHLNLIMSSAGVKFIAQKLEFEEGKDETKKARKKEVVKAVTSSVSSSPGSRKTEIVKTTPAPPKAAPKSKEASKKKANPKPKPAPVKKTGPRKETPVRGDAKKTVKKAVVSKKPVTPKKPAGKPPRK